MKAQVSTSAGVSEVRFRVHLQEELARRCAANARYSLRAFARRLRVDHSTLSKLLRGTRPFTETTIASLGARLGLTTEVIARFVEAERLPDDLSKTKEVRQLTDDAAALLADWQHYAILELTRLGSFKPDVRWIARVLGLKVDEVNVALNRLTRLGLLVMTDTDRWTDSAGDIVSSLDDYHDRTVSGLSDWLRAMRDTTRAAPAHYSATTVAVAESTGRRAVERLERLRRELIQLLESDTSARDQVYRLEIAFFPLTTHDPKE